MTPLLGEIDAANLDEKRLPWEVTLYGAVDKRKMPTLTPRRAKALLLQVAAERPGYVHPRHEYLHRGRPGCLVAHVLRRHGASLAALDAADVADERGGSLPVTRLPETRYFSRLDARAAELLGAAQRLQDLGYPWSYAARVAVRRWAA